MIRKEKLSPSSDDDWLEIHFITVRLSTVPQPRREQGKSQFDSFRRVHWEKRRCRAPNIGKAPDVSVLEGKMFDSAVLTRME
jgi:hypothetical protein